jgi:hypothetical protein
MTPRTPTHGTRPPRAATSPGHGLGILSIALCLVWACDGEISQQEMDGSRRPVQGDAGMTPGSADMAARPDLGGAGDMERELGDMHSDAGSEPMEPAELTGNDLTHQQDELFMCASGVASPSPARQRLIDRGEWQRNVGLRSAGASLSPFDPLQKHPYSTFVEGETMNPEVLDVYMNMSSVSADAWMGPKSWIGSDGKPDSIRWTAPFKSNPMLVAHVGRLSCLIDERKPTPDDACIDDFTKLLLEQAVLHKPARPVELSALSAYAKRAIEAEAQPATREQRRDTVRKIVQAAWMTTGALFSGEGFDVPPNAQGVSMMSDWEIAHALSYALGQIDPGSVIDGDSSPLGAFPLIVEAAKDGSISDPSTIATLVETYATRGDVTSSKRSVYLASYGIQQFFREWLGYMSYLQQTKDTPHATTAYDEKLVKNTYIFAVNGPRHSGSSQEAQLFVQLDDMIARILHEDTDVFRELLTSREYYIAADVSAQIGDTSNGDNGGSPQIMYGVETGTLPTQEGRWATIPDSVRRAGVLTHPAWLASHSLNFENDPNPVHRGKWIREELLCGQVPPTPITVEAALDPETKDQTTRDRVKQKTEQGSCVGCHALMNPLGYPFEIYNHIGILRDDDHGKAPDGSSMLVNMPDPALNGPLRDAVEMSEKLANSQFVKRCFIRQSFRYFMGREETMQDACVLSQMEAAYDERGSFKAMLQALWTSPAFLERQHPVEMP